MRTAEILMTERERYSLQLFRRHRKASVHHDAVVCKCKLPYAVRRARIRTGWASGTEKKAWQWHCHRQLLPRVVFVFEKPCCLLLLDNDICDLWQRARRGPETSPWQLRSLLSAGRYPRHRHRNDIPGSVRARCCIVSCRISMKYWNSFQLSRRSFVPRAGNPRCSYIAWNFS